MPRYPGNVTMLIWITGAKFGQPLSQRVNGTKWQQVTDVHNILTLGTRTGNELEITGFKSEEDCIKHCIEM